MKIINIEIIMIQIDPTYKYPKPKIFELMKAYAKKLSKDFKFVKKDLYELENEISLGELTFIPMNNFFWRKNKSNDYAYVYHIFTVYFLNILIINQ